MRKIRRKIVQNLIEKDFTNENELIIWHDVINNSICRHKSIFYRALSVSDIINVLKSYQNRIRALMYCQRNRRTDIFLQLKETNRLVFSLEQDFTKHTSRKDFTISLRKQKALEYLKNLEALHQSPDMELKHLNLVLEYEIDLSQIIARGRPKRASKHARKALKKTLFAANE